MREIKAYITIPANTVINAVACPVAILSASAVPVHGLTATVEAVVDPGAEKYLRVAPTTLWLVDGYGGFNVYSNTDWWIN